MPSITDPEVRAFLTAGTRTGKLSYLSAGRPGKIVANFDITG